jgi:uncharacterized protein YdaU (DUF1376 family)
MAKRAWMPFYVADYLGDTGDLTTTEHGAYFLLILHYWRNEGLPTDHAQLRRITKLSVYQWKKIGPRLAMFFDADWKHGRIERELERASVKMTEKTEAGRHGAGRRWGDVTPGDTRSARLARAREKGRHTPAEWDAMVEVFGGACVACGADDAKPCRDHITPIYRGGSDAIENIQPLCLACNSKKGPDATDYRAEAVPEWRAAFAERLAANARQPRSGTPAQSQKTQSEKKTKQQSETSVPTREAEPGGFVALSRSGLDEVDQGKVAVGDQPPGGKYAIVVSEKIRLTHADLARWRQAFTLVNIHATLIGQQGWLEAQPNWFTAAAALLAKFQRQAEERARASANAAAGYDPNFYDPRI